MKTAVIFFLGLSFLGLLTSCMPCVETRCGYQKDYGHPYYGCDKCGPRIKYRCDYICNTCLGNEPSCKACWSCINNEGCAGYYVNEN